MKTILVYSNQPSGGYKELALSMIREGRRRGWRFTWGHGVLDMVRECNRMKTAKCR